MSKKLFIGNLSWGVDNEELKRFFEEIGEVEEAVIVNDRDTGRSRGFGFVTYVNEEDAQKAVADLDGQELDGRDLVVNEAKPSNKDRDRR